MNVEYLVILVAVVVPFGLLCVVLCNHLVPFYGLFETLNGVPIP